MSCGSVSVLSKSLREGLIVLFSFNEGVTSWHHGPGFDQYVKTLPGFGETVLYSFQ